MEGTLREDNELAGELTRQDGVEAAQVAAARGGVEGGKPLPAVELECGARGLGSVFEVLRIHDDTL